MKGTLKMDLKQFIAQKDEKPLDNLVTDGGLCGIFRTIACVGDSLSSGEFESLDDEGKKDYHDMYEYSWGQYIAREAGCKVYNFSRGGMSAQWYCDSFADEKDFWNEDKKCQCYIFALGVNDLHETDSIEMGSVKDIDVNDWRNNKKTFAGYYAQIIQRLKENQPHAKFFLMTIPKSEDSEGLKKIRDNHAKLLYDMAELFDYTYVLDLRKYAPEYDAEFKHNFYLGGHMNPAGYMLTAKMVMSYIDYLIRHNPEDFAQVGFIGTGHHNVSAKW